MALRRHTDEVFFADDPIAQIGPEDLAFLRRQAEANPRRRARICAHRTSADALHEMIIAMAQDCYIHPHRHVGKSESFHIVEGVVDVPLFDDCGNVADVISLGDRASGRTFFYRIADMTYHGLVIRSPMLIFHEVTNGPFRPDTSGRAPFAPSSEDLAATSAFMARITAEVDQILAARQAKEKK